MLQTFTDNRAEAQTAEDTAASNHASLMSAKNSQLGATKQALLDKADLRIAHHLLAMPKSKTDTDTPDPEAPA